MEVFSVSYIKKEPQTLETLTCQMPGIDLENDSNHKDPAECPQEVGSSLQIDHVLIKEEAHDLFCEGEETEPYIVEALGKVSSSIQEDHGNSSWIEAKRARSTHSPVLDQMSLTLGNKSDAFADVRTSIEAGKEERHFPSEVTNLHDGQNHYGAHDSQPGFPWQSSEEDKGTTEHEDNMYNGVYEETSSLSGQREENRNGWSLNDTTPSVGTPDSGDAGERTYSCNKCGKGFATQQGVNSHMQYHKPHHCPKCNKGYYSNAELTEHMTTHNVEQEMLFQCTYLDCDKEFPNYQGLNRHMQTHPQERPFHCPECDKSFGSNSYLRFHMKLHTREPKFRCAECGEGFHRDGHFARHMAKHTGQKLFKCPVCHKEYNFKGRFDIHIKTHIKNGDLLYKCTLCSTTYPAERFTELQGEKPYLCIDCKKGFLEEQVKQGTVYKKDRGFRCPHCHERFLKVVELKKHVVDGHPDKEFNQCPKCDKTFPLKLQLTVHLQIHRKEKQDCPLCGAVLVSKRALKNHLSMHRGERKYKCSVCDKTYRQLSSLKNHIITHSGIKFKCGVCDKAFSNKGQMRRHEKKHSMVKPRGKIRLPLAWVNVKINEVCQEDSSSPVKIPQDGKEQSIGTENNPDLKCRVIENDSATSGQKYSQSGLEESSSSMSFEGEQLSNGMFDSNRIPSSPTEGLQTDATIPQTGQTEDQPYSCHKCEKNFTTMQALNSHMQYHKPYHCPTCNKGYYSKFELAEHMEAHNVDQEMLYECSYPNCGKAFATRQGLISHIQRHPCERPFACPDCDKAFGSKNNLRVHMKLHTREPKFRCVECGEGFLREGHFARHMAKHAGQKLFTCPFCLKAYNFKRRFDAHLKTHTEDRERTYKCSQCDKTYPSEFVRKLEGKLQKCTECDAGFLEEQAEDGTFHKKRKCVRCHHCHKRFPKVVDLLKHLETVHPGKDSHKCPECHKTFPLKSKLSVHLQVHRKEKQICPLCGVVLVSKRSLKGHLRKHRGERNHKCSTCGEKFLHVSSLKYHTRIHTGDKPYKCTMCDKSFVCNNSLKSHLRTHTGEKTHLCSLCGKMFRDKRDLQSHVRWHAGERPFECVDCNKSYTSSSSLRLHMRTHAGGKQFPCPKCSDRFYTKTVLRAHLKTHS